MKTRLLIIISVLILIPTQLVYGPPAPDHQSAYDYAEHVLIGKILSVEILSAPNKDPSVRSGVALYEIQVEEYLKNPLDTDIVTVPGRYVYEETSRGNADLLYEVGQRVFLYIQKDFPDYLPNYDLVIRDYESGVLDGPPCGANATYQEGKCIIDKTGVQVDASVCWEHPTCNSSVVFPETHHKSEFLITEKQVRYNIPYVISNGMIDDMTLFCEHGSLLIDVSSQSEHDVNLDVEIPRNMLDPKTDGNDGRFFILRDGDEIGYDEIPYKDYRKLSISFSPDTDKIEIIHAFVLALKPLMCKVVDNPPYSFILSPLKQFQSGVPINEIQCPNEDHVLTERPNDKLACVYPETAKHLKWNIYTNVVLNEVVSNMGVSDYYDKKSSETQFCTGDMIEFLDKNSNIFYNNEPYSSPLDGDVLQGIDINPDNMIQCENELYEKRTLLSDKVLKSKAYIVNCDETLHKEELPDFTIENSTHNYDMQYCKWELKYPDLTLINNANLLNAYPYCAELFDTLFDYYQSISDPCGMQRYNEDGTPRGVCEPPPAGAGVPYDINMIKSGCVAHYADWAYLTDHNDNVFYLFDRMEIHNKIHGNLDEQIKIIDKLCEDNDHRNAEPNIQFRNDTHWIDTDHCELERK